MQATISWMLFFSAPPPPPPPPHTHTHTHIHHTLIFSLSFLIFSLSFPQSCSWQQHQLIFNTICQFAAIFKCIFLNENIWILLKISLKFIRKVPKNNIASLVQIMDWRHAGEKPLSEPMMVRLLTHICVTVPHWVNEFRVFHLHI